MIELKMIQYTNLDLIEEELYLLRYMVERYFPKSFYVNRSQNIGF